MRARISALRFSSARSAAVLSVTKYPGAIAFTLMPCGAHSFASSFVEPCEAALARGVRSDAHAALKRQHRRDVDDLAAAAAARSACRATACDRKNTLFKLTLSTSSQSCLVEVQRVVAANDAGVVDEDVDAVEAFAAPPRRSRPRLRESSRSASTNAKRRPSAATLRRSRRAACGRRRRCRRPRPRARTQAPGRARCSRPSRAPCAVEAE